MVALAPYDTTVTKSTDTVVVEFPQYLDTDLTRTKTERRGLRLDAPHMKANTTPKADQVEDGAPKSKNPRSRYILPAGGVTGKGCGDVPRMHTQGKTAIQTELDQTHKIFRDQRKNCVCVSKISPKPKASERSTESNFGRAAGSRVMDS